jgi:hypothetical protein
LVFIDIFIFCRDLEKIKILKGFSRNIRIADEVKIVDSEQSFFDILKTDFFDLFILDIEIEKILEKLDDLFE